MEMCAERSDWRPGSFLSAESRWLPSSRRAALARGRSLGVVPSGLKHAWTNPRTAFFDNSCLWPNFLLPPLSRFVYSFPLSPEMASTDRQSGGKPAMSRKGENPFLVIPCHFSRGEKEAACIWGEKNETEPSRLVKLVVE